MPWADGDDVYLGTTDTDWDGPLDDPACLPQDVDYVIEAANGSTTSALTRADVSGVWAGLRPLLDPGDKHVSERTKDLSRRHTVHTSDHGVVTVTGGKLTTYRRMAEQTVDAAAKVLHRSGIGPSKTRHLRLIGAPARGSDAGRPREPEGRGPSRGVRVDLLEALVRRHGTETPAVLDLASDRQGPARTSRRGIAVPESRSRVRGTRRDGVDHRRRPWNAEPVRSFARAEATIDAADAVALRCSLPSSDVTRPTCTQKLASSCRLSPRP